MRLWCETAVYGSWKRVVPVGMKMCVVAGRLRSVAMRPALPAALGSAAGSPSGARGRWRQSGRRAATCALPAAPIVVAGIFPPVLPIGSRHPQNFPQNQEMKVYSAMLKLRKIFGSKPVLPDFAIKSNWTANNSRTNRDEPAYLMYFGLLSSSSVIQKWSCLNLTESRNLATLVKTAKCRKKWMRHTSNAYSGVLTQ